jgi:NADH:ubiquinone oxidoreductase subunit 6 (subunit J)
LTVRPGHPGREDLEHAGEWIVMQFLFLLIAAIGLATALGTVLARNLVHAALFLIAFFFTIACQFVLLEAEFLAALQVLVYIGAVAIILMFGIMLTRNIQGDDPTTAPSAWQVPGLFAGACVFVILAYGIASQNGLSGRRSWANTKTRPGIVPVANQPPSPRMQAVNNMGKVAGDELLTRYVIGFEVAGLLLTAALVGAIALAHREEAEPSAGGSTRRTVREREAAVPVEAGANAATRAL